MDANRRKIVEINRAIRLLFNEGFIDAPLKDSLFGSLKEKQYTKEFVASLERRKVFVEKEIAAIEGENPSSEELNDSYEFVTGVVYKRREIVELNSEISQYKNVDSGTGTGQARGLGKNQRPIL